MHKNPDTGTASAPAKLNLYLHVLGRGLDGYHQLESLAVFTGFGDVVQVQASPAISLNVGGPFAAQCGPAEANLVLRAARALAELAPAPAGAAITLYKYLPVASGLGGGSSDAAATLRQLMQLWRLSPDSQALAALALRLGADVPACLHAAPVVMRGAGEQLTLAPPLPETCVLLVNPGLPLSTPAVFQNLRGRLGAAPPPLPARIPDCKTLAQVLASRRNDLQGPAIELMPEIQVVLDALASQRGCLLARMSGSGATCFGLFESAGEMEGAADALHRQYPEYWLARTQFPARA